MPVKAARSPISVHIRWPVHGIHLLVTGYSTGVHVLVTVLAKTVCGGLLVVAFAVLSEALKPKRFAGILSAAPSVAIAGLAIGSALDGPSQQATAAWTMIAGAVALTVYALVVVPALGRLGPAKGSAVSSAVWVAVAAASYLVLR